MGGGARKLPIQLGKKLGLSLALGGLSPQAQIARVAIVSNLPFRQVRFSSISQPDRYCAVRIGQSIQKLLVCAIYGNAVYQALAKELVQELVTCASQFSCQWVILGDFNLTPLDCMTLMLVAVPSCWTSHLDRQSWCHLLGLVAKRRIDFGMFVPSLHPTCLKHVQGLGAIWESLSPLMLTSHC